MTKQYSALLGLEKSIFRTIVVASPLLIGVLPEAWMNITLGMALTFLVNYAKNRNLKEVEDSSGESQG